jgi:zinc protease
MSAASEGLEVPGASTEGVVSESAPAPVTGPVIHVRRVPGAPVVAIRAAVPGGARVEPVPGLVGVTGRLLTEGTRRRSWERLAAETEALGMDPAGGGNFDRHLLSLDALADDWERAVDWVAELLLESTFPEDRCRWVCRQVAAELESLGDRPEVRTAWAFLEQLYTPHPMSRPVQGTRASLASLEASACAAFHRERLDQGLIVGIAGELDETAVTRRIEGLLAELQGRNGTPVEPPAPRGLPETRQVVELDPGENGAAQAHLFAGHPTIPRYHPDYEALELAGVVLGAGAGLTGRIPQRIREQEGLAYSARGNTVAGCGLDPGRLLVYVGTSAATVEQAERGVREEIERLVEGGISEQEMEEARSYLLGREPFERETARQWADLLTDAVLYGIPLDEPGWRERRLAELTRERVDEALRHHLHPDRVKVTVGIPESTVLR